MTRVLLLGGTGAMGVYLQQILAAQGQTVFVTSRSAREDGQGLRFFRGDAHNPGFLLKVAAEVKPDAIVDFMVYNTYDFLRRVKYVLDLSAQYLFLSSYRVFADSMPIVESSPRLLDVCDDAVYLQTDEYALAKARQEDALRSAAKSNWTIVRPAITYSKERFQFGVLEADVVCWRALHGLPVVMPEEMLEKQTTMTWGKDVARMIAGLIGNPRAFGEDFNCATAEHRSWREVAEIYRQAIGLNVVTCSSDDYVWGGNKYQIAYDRMFNRVLDNSKVLCATGIEQSSLMPLSVGLSKELVAFKGHPRYAKFDLERNARMDFLTGSRIPQGLLHGKDRWKYLALRYPRRGFGLAARTICKIKCALTSAKRLKRVFKGTRPA